MNTSKLDQAREWAETVKHYDDTYGRGENAAAEVINALPDQWIDAEKVAELADDMANWSLLEMPSTAESDCRHLIELLGGFADRINDLLAPPLPTLDELTRGLDKDIEQYRWMQAEVFHTGERGAITDFNLYAETATVLFPNGVMKNVLWEDITPLPDLPKLEWPGSTPDDVAYATGGALTTQDVVDECRAVRKERATMEPTLPRPEDVPAGEAWLILHDDHEWVGTRDDSSTTNYPWALAKIDGTNYAFSRDVEVTLVSRLVSEVAP